MKRCDHTRWLSICGRRGSPALVQSDRPAAIVDDLPSPDTQPPSFFVLNGNAEKSIVLRAWTYIFEQCRGEMHLYLD
jgi:hypothetical protein